jgi:hypothetical protein
MVGPKLKTMGSYLAPALFAALWIVSIERKWMLRDPYVATNALIASNDRLVQNYVRSYGEAPESLNDLRLYARYTANRYAAFDVWGQRLEYLHLGKVNYTIRSFGDDGIQNHAGQEADPGVFRWGPSEPHGLTYDDANGSKQHRPSVVLFAGADDSTGTWNAKLFVDPITGSRRLLVRRHDSNRFFMLASHDGVEEFLWIPGQQKIVFTASQSVRYSDGAYIWDLTTDESYNLFTLDGDKSDLDPGNKQKNLYLALSYVKSGVHPEVGIYATLSNSQLLDPAAFFHEQNLHVFTLGDHVTHVVPKKLTVIKPSDYSVEFLGTGTLQPGGEGSSLQKAWLQLPMGGDWEKAVLSWQEFAEHHNKTQLAPYAIWGIAMFYSEASKAAGVESKNGQIFRSYGIELGRALSSMPVAPGYIRAIGAWIGLRH